MPVNVHMPVLLSPEQGDAHKEEERRKTMKEFNRIRA